MTRNKTVGLALAGIATLGVLGVSVLSASGAPRAVDVKTGVQSAAAGVNEGTKAQAPGIAMRPITPVDPSVVGEYGKYGGCTPGYGRAKGGAKGCLPPISPSAVAMGMTEQEHPWTCVEVRKLLPKGISVSVKGVDPIGLDRNDDGLACGVGD